MDNFDLRKFLVENKLTKNSKHIKEDFAPSPNSDVPNANAEEYDVATAFKKAGVDMSRPVTVIHMYGSTPSEGSDEDEMSAEAAVEQLESERQQNQRNYTDDGREVPSDIHGYEFENYTVLEDDMPEGHEYKLSYTNMSGEDTYVIVQEKSETVGESAGRAEPDFRQEATRFPELVGKHGEAKVADALEALYDNARDAVEAGHATSVEDAYENSLEMLKQDPEGLEDLMSESVDSAMEEVVAEYVTEALKGKDIKEVTGIIEARCNRAAMELKMETIAEVINAYEGRLSEVKGSEHFIEMADESKVVAQEGMIKGLHEMAIAVKEEYKEAYMKKEKAPKKKK